jgi:hypothetical protein
MTRGRKSVDSPNSLPRKFAKQLAETRALATDKRDIARANLAKIQNIWFRICHNFF